MSTERLVFKIPYERVEDIPLDEYKNLHKQYWMFIAENHLNYKPQILSEQIIEYLDICSSCFACEYLNMCDSCKVCPIVYFRDISGACYCYKNGSIYDQWWDTGSTEMAIKIANLEWEDTHKNVET